MEVSRAGAIELAEAFCAVGGGPAIDEASVQELVNGWFIGWRWNLGPDGLPSQSTPLGCNGPIINKASGAILSLGSAFPIERDIRFYEQGFQSELYDLVILEIRDLDRTLESLKRLGPVIVEPEYETGTVWRIPRPLDRNELADRVRSLPCVFGDVPLYSRLEELARAKVEDWYRFRAIGRPSK